MIKLFSIFFLGIFVLNSCYEMPTFDNKNDPQNNVGSIPNAPILSSPTTGVQNITIPIEFKWRKSLGASSYSLQISPDNQFIDSVSTFDNIIDTVQQLTDLYDSTTYYWRVNAKNNFGTSDWSLTFSLTTVTTGTAPVAPILQSPANGSTGQTVNPTLSWNASTGANSYTLQVSTTNTFSTFVFNQNIGNLTSSQVTALLNDTTYYWRVNASNSYGSSGWSDTWSFTTISFCGTSQISYSGKTYNIVQIGTQCWLKENLDVGTRINGSQNASNNSMIEKYCYNDDPANCTTYGGLYQWNEAMQYVTTPSAKGICPTGWHIPTLAEFTTLSNSAPVGGDGNTLKEIGQGTGGGAGTNTSGFSALLAGYRYVYGGSFSSLGTTTLVWISSESTSTTAYCLYLNFNDSGIALNYGTKQGGFSVRCVKD